MCICVYLSRPWVRMYLFVHTCVFQVRKCYQIWTLLLGTWKINKIIVQYLLSAEICACVHACVFYCMLSCYFQAHASKGNILAPKSAVPGVWFSPPQETVVQLRSHTSVCHPSRPQTQQFIKEQRCSSCPLPEKVITQKVITQK